MYRTIMLALFITGCSPSNWFNDPVNHGTEFMKRDWAKHRDCGTICDYESGHMCTAFKLNETQCRCGDLDAREFNKLHPHMPLDTEHFDFNCKPDCKTYAAQIRVQQPWRY